MGVKRTSSSERGARVSPGGGPPPRECGRGAGRDRLLVLLSRLAQVDVDVDQAGGDDHAGRDLEHLGAVRRQVATDTADGAVLDQDVERAVPAVTGVDHASVLQQQFHSPPLSSLPASRYNTAIRTATPFDTCSRMTE